MKIRHLVKGYLWQRWDSIPDYEGFYRCSTLGKVKSLGRTIICSNGRSRKTNDKILKNGINNYYPFIILYKIGNYKGIQIHRLVAITFLNHIPDGHKNVVDHIDGNKMNNKVSNLRIVTNRENSSVCFRKNKYNISSIYSGVSWDNNRSKWRATIKIENTKKHLGYFNDEKHASTAYKNAIIENNLITIL